MGVVGDATVEAVLEAAAENAAGTGGHPLIGQCPGAEVGLLHPQEGEDVPDQTSFRLILTESEVNLNTLVFLSNCILKHCNEYFSLSFFFEFSSAVNSAIYQVLQVPCFVSSTVIFNSFSEIKTLFSMGK